MSSSSTKGNNPEKWDKLLRELDEKLQLGLLDHMKRVATYHFEEDILYLEPANKDEEKYLLKDQVLHHLELLAQDILGVDKVKIKRLE